MGKKKKHLKRKLKRIRFFYEGMYDQLQLVEQQKADLYLDYRYLIDFIYSKGMSDEYYYFRRNAHEVIDDDNPFGYFTL